MEFEEALNLVSNVLSAAEAGNVESDINRYDGLIVKKLESSNTLDSGRTTKQSHIAITGDQMDFFPSISANGYLIPSYEQQDNDLKKYFVLRIPAYLHKENVKYIDSTSDLFSEKEKLVNISIVRSRRKNATDQLQMSMVDLDSKTFIVFRNMVHTGSYLIMLKRYRRLEYDLYCLKSEDGEDLIKLNNNFYKRATKTTSSSTVVDYENIAGYGPYVTKIELNLSHSKESAKKIIDIIYDIDKFKKLNDIFESTDQYIKINTKELGRSYLSRVFLRPTANALDIKNENKRIRWFDDIYLVPVGKDIENCKLSTEWISKDLEEPIQSDNYLIALIRIVNSRYKGMVTIFEEDSKCYVYQTLKFSLDEMPSEFETPFAERYIKSLLAKPFVILTGNSGTGKTRVATRMAEYLGSRPDSDEKNWALVSVGADWTDNTKILGYYNPLADEGKGKYEKTEILELIERANQNPEKPFFLILDEMNLSQVERYFSDFLSHMEIPDLPFKIDGYDNDLKYPSNLFITGTVNIDETTYMFSPKVLDRANVIEYNPDEEDVLKSFRPVLGTENTKSASAYLPEAFLNLSKSVRDGKCDLSDDQMNEAENFLRLVYDNLKEYDYEFAYRTVKEIRQYFSVSYELSEDKADFSLTEAEDEQLVQKILPKIHGNKKEIGNLLDNLSKLCGDGENIKFPIGKAKIDRMKRKLDQVQYASFI